MNANQLVDSYVKWLRQNMTVKKVSDTVWEVTVPFLDSHCDHLSIQIEETDTGLFLSDVGSVLVDLYLGHTELEAITRSIVDTFGVRISDRELVIAATREDFPKKLNRLIQVMLLVSWLCLQYEKERPKATDSEKTLDDLAREQGVKPVDDLNTLGTWPGEVEDGLEAFIEELRHGK